MVFAGLVALIFIAQIAQTLIDRSQGGVSDLRVYYEGAARLRDGQPLYITDVNFLEQPMQYLYPPPLALLLMPLKTYAATWWVWAAFSLICWVGSLALILRELWGELREKVPPAWRPLLLAGLIAFTPVLSHLFWGQTQLYLLLLLTGGWLLMRRDRDISAGVLIGIAVAIKVFPVLVFAPLFARRRWRCLFAASATAGVILGVSYTLVGWDQAYLFVTKVLPDQAGALATYTTNHTTFAAMLTNAFGNAALASYISLALRALIMAAVLLAAWRARDAASALTLGVTTLVLVSPVVWEHYFVLIYLPWLEALARSPRRRLPLLVLAYFLLALANLIYHVPADLKFVAQLLPITGALLLLGCQLSNVRDAAARQPLAPSDGVANGQMAS
jgi:alpha-1,2-mannosyltransferase